MAFQVQILTIFPDFFTSIFNTGLLSKAIDRGHLNVDTFDIRAHATDKHRTTDDVPYGGGAGMVMKCEPIVGAIEEAQSLHPNLTRIYLSPQGQRFDQTLAYELADSDGFMLLCGRYEGVDERVRQNFIDREISIGDYVLTGGEPAAAIVVDAVARLLPGVLGNMESLLEESHTGPLLEYPHYTRPREFRGLEVPEVLLSGHHGKIAQWRHEQSLQRTRARRPDLLETPQDQEE